MWRFLPILLLPWLIAPAQAQGSSWRVLNLTGQEAVRLVVAEAGSLGARGRNRLRQPLANRGEKRFRRKADAPCRMDLRLVVADGREALMRGQDVCAQPLVVFEAASVQAGAARQAAGRAGRSGASAQGASPVATDRGAAQGGK
ncbi:hypothetical protein [Roseomonas xinghualingensis]|uniref:hypothetical protein n=1 Tax=Roseomonas xinghualingensis TaxID=2986475 RepID=UPI0021F10B85|nr:hypothetical protein [Roseomonas sp. SXEYE001]MCV4205922.1 hypothetical protein [Roseomonas sp. SXEYE001]